MGLLAGIILEIKEDNNFTLKDLNQNIWQIKRIDAAIRGGVDFKTGSQIKLIGAMEDGFIFTAEEIRPWIGRGEFKSERNNQHRLY